MLPKVETRVVLVGEAGRNGALLKALQVFSPNPKAPRLLPVKSCVNRNCLIIEVDVMRTDRRLYAQVQVEALLPRGVHPGER